MQKTGNPGGGQLGRMLLQAAANYPVETFVMENDAECPAAHLCHHFIKGDIKNFDDVYNFGNVHIPAAIITVIFCGSCFSTKNINIDFRNKWIEL
jgi:phosphoribosylaminoimidazole carboxylase (NCAIR synthetase)